MSIFVVYKKPKREALLYMVTVYIREDIVRSYVMWLWNYYSMLLMSVRTVKKDIDDWTLSVPLSVNKKLFQVQQ